MDLPVLIANVPVGGYVSLWKVLPVVIVLLVWARLLTWIDKDAPEVMLPRVPINLGMVSAFILGVALLFVLPGFAIAFTVLVVLMLAGVGTYLFIRNQKVGLKDLGTQFTEWKGSFGGKKKEVAAPVGDVQLLTKGGSNIPAPTAEDPTRVGYESVQRILSEPMRKWAEQVDLKPADGGTFAVRYIVDGVPYSGDNLSKDAAAAGVGYLKEVAGLDVAEKRKPQRATIKVTVAGKRHELALTTAGSASGEQLRVEVDPKGRHHKKLDELGFSAEQAEQIREIIRDPTGVVIVSAPKGQGLTSTLYGILRAHDAFLTHIQTLEPEPDMDLEGITQNSMGPTGNPAEDVQKITWAISQEPDVLACTRVENTKAAQALANIGGSKLVYVGLRSGSTFEALSAWRKLVGDDRLAMKNLRMIINGRVMRKLCAACKVGYKPDPTTLRKLNMDPSKIDTLYQARTTPLRDPKGNPIPCEFCRELQFKGRTGVYETLLVDDDIKLVMEGGGSGNQLKAAFRKQKGRYLQEQALAQVEGGETSVQEVLRVMKASETPSSAGTSSSGGARASAARSPSNR